MHLLMVFLVYASFFSDFYTDRIYQAFQSIYYKSYLTIDLGPFHQVLNSTLRHRVLLLIFTFFSQSLFALLTSFHYMGNIAKN